MTLWTPDLLATLDTWYKGDTLTGTGGSSLSGWTDSSGHGHTATVPGISPTLVLAGLNGINVAAFSTTGGSEAFDAPVTTGGVYTCIATARWSGGQCFRVITTNTGINWLIGWHDAGSDACYANGAIAFPGAGSTSTTAWLSYCLVGNGATNQSFYKDGTLIASSTAAGSPYGPDNQVRLGGGYNNAEYSDCEVAEMCYFAGALSTTDRQLVEGYMAWHWGRQASLPGGHPYASAAPTITEGAPARDTHTAIPFTRGAGGGGKI